MFNHAIALCFDFANDEETLVMTKENLPAICAAVKRRLDDILSSTNLEAFADINDTHEELVCLADPMNQGHGRYEFTITVGATGENADEAWDCIVNAELFNDGAPEPDGFEPDEEE